MKPITFIIFILFAFQLKGFCQVKKTGLPADTLGIVEVAFRSTGSIGGGLLDMTINKDSTHYYFSGYSGIFVNYSKRKTVSQKTDPAFWKRLVNSINISDFDNAPNAKPTAYIDGNDVGISIKTIKKSHGLLLEDYGAIYDNFMDKKYESIQQFICLLVDYTHQIQNQ